MNHPSLAEGRGMDGTARTEPPRMRKRQRTEDWDAQGEPQSFQLTAPIPFTIPCCTPLLPHLRAVHQTFEHSLRLRIESLIWPESIFPGDICYCPIRLQPWIHFPRLQEEVWNKLLNISSFADAAIFPDDNALRPIAQIVDCWASVFSENTLKYFQHRTVDDFLILIIRALGNDHKLAPLFNIQGELVFDRPGAYGLSIGDMGFEQPICAMLYIPSYWLTVPELVAGLHAMETYHCLRKKPDTYQEHATAMVVHAIIQVFTRMISAGVHRGYICTGEAFVFVNIPPKEPIVLEYYLCVPGQDVPSHAVDADSKWVRRTALGQVLAFTLQLLSASEPSQEWHDKAHSSLQVSQEIYSSLMPKDPDQSRFRPPAKFLYENSFWVQGWGSFLGIPAPPEGGNLSSQTTQSTERAYCTMKCLRGTADKELLDEKCPNVAEHGVGRHSISSQEITARLSDQLQQSRDEGFRQLHIIGRTCYLLKATLLSHGYTVIIKATSSDHSHRIKCELRNYKDLILLQGSKIPVCLGMFEPKVPYWYHGTLMRYMLVLSWSGIRTDYELSPEARHFVDREMSVLKRILFDHGAIHRDLVPRNVLYNAATRSLIVIDLEDMKWLQGTVQGSEPCDGPGIDAIRDNKRKTITCPSAYSEPTVPSPRLWHS
ncbi:uncharacterized protein N7515_005040 [Penicillium bovifimosum]|uniref:Protein kinase domain-containing protein n=1 Tax=Penicillium bovifimosum TaxID=126998 RepID=A0A9W9H1B6_9EURO|nr:uncharacterized protein N7515_005040 [Penicillium bovifimosum]KAJ5135762.1 hypothetical protein N7515_005040 [Penicillium bovifimosum]